jgi:SAM-dependent methyltransferase
MRRNYKHMPLVLALLSSCGGFSGEKAAADSSEHARPPPPRAHRQAHHQAHHHRFEDAAAWSKVFDDPARDAWQRPADVVSSMAIAPGMTVADVGAGTGYFEPHLSRAVGPEGKVIAVDVEPDMVRFIDERAKREGLANVHAVLADTTDPKLAPGSVDRVLVVDTWHHIDDRAAYARKLAVALRAGGSVIIVDFTKDSPHGPPPEARLSPEEVIADLTAAGLAARRVEAGLPHQFVIAGDRRPTL